MSELPEIHKKSHGGQLPIAKIKKSLSKTRSRKILRPFNLELPVGSHRTDNLPAFASLERYEISKSNLKMFSTAIEDTPDEELAAEQHLLAPEYTTTTTAFEPKI